MKCYFFEFVFDSFKIPQISKHVFLLRSTFVIEDFDEYSILVFKLRFLTFLRAEVPWFCLHFVSKNPLQKCAGKKLFFLQMVFFTKWLMTKVDRSKNTYFLFFEIFIKSKCHSKKFDFIMLFPNLALTTLSKWILS